MSLLKYLRNRSIKAKLFLSFALLFILLSCVITTARSAINDLKSIQVDIFEKDIPAASDLMVLGDKIGKIQSAVQMLIMVDNTTVKDHANYNLEQAIAESKVCMERLESRFSDNQTRKLFQRLKSLLKNFQGEQHRGLIAQSQRLIGDDEKSKVLYLRRSIFREMTAISYELNGLPAKWAKNRLSLSTEKENQSSKFFVATAVLALTITILLTAVLSSWMLEPLQKLTKAARNISAGKMDIVLNDDGREDEIGQLAKSFAIMEQSLFNRTKQLHSAFEELNSSNEQFQRVASEAEAAKGMLKAALDSMVEGFCQIDANGSIVYMNPAADRLLACERREVVGMNLHAIVHPNCLGQNDCAIGQISDGYEREDQFSRLDSSLLPVRFSTAFLTQSGEVRGTVLCFRDNSERAAAEQRVAEFYSTVSHELRTPMTAIKGSLGLIEGGIMGDVSDAVLEMVGVARTSCDRLIRLINEILDLRKVEAGKMELQAGCYRAEELVEVAVNGVTGMASEYQVKVVADCPQSLMVQADFDRIIQVLTNFLSNAIKFSDPGSMVKVAVTLKSPQRVCFNVIDQGPGIPKAQMEKLFIRFQQLDSSDTRSHGGTGLGLAISKALVELHGGRVGLESVVGKGSSFWFDLPAPEAIPDQSSYLMNQSRAG